MLKKFSLLLSSVSLMLFMTLQIAYAASSVKVGPCATDDARFNRLCNNSTAGQADNILRNIIMGAMTVAAVLALFFLIFGGFKWITSGGDKAKVEAARNMIVAAIIGLVLTLLSYLILSIVLNIFNIQLTDLSLPRLQQQ